MNLVTEVIRRLVTLDLGKEEGQSMVEYGLIIALVAVVVAVALTAMAGNISNLFNGLKF